MSTRGWICEIFASIQGEGLYCGQRQTFIRLAGCNLACGYCDTATSRVSRPESCAVQSAAGSGVFETVSNPVAADQAVSICRELGPKVVSITGGEPLFQPDFLTVLLRDLKRDGFRTYLETNGTLHDELEAVVSNADIIAMDIKLRSATGEPTMWLEHEKFLEIAKRSEVFVKVVVSNATSDDEIRRCAKLVSGIDPNIALVIQPRSGDTFPTNFLMSIQESASETLADVRVIPQCHKILGLL